MRGTRLTYAVAMVILCHILTSCAQGFMGQGFLKDPRLYNPKKTTGADQSVAVAPEPELGLTGGVDPFDNTDQWYNKPDSNGDESNPNEGGFGAEEFQRIQIAGWFSSENVPTYTMTAADVWAAGDESRREYVHAGAPNTEGQGWTINGVTYYQYRGINPGYAADGNYNKTLQSTGKGHPKLSRFFFYRFTGKGGGIQWLDNNLIAVDTHSKLVFAFSEPVEFSSMGAPTRWSPTDASPYIGQMYQFYQYDPVGYVKKKADGGYEVVLYQWFQDNLAKGNYKAKIDTAYTKIAEKKPDGAGKSPFNNHTADFFVENMKLLAGTPFYRREVTQDGGNGLVLYTYMVSEDGKTITRRAESWNGLATSTDLNEKTYNVGEGTTATKGSVTGEYSGELELADESRTLRFGNGEVAVSNFTDPGPDWLERVKHGPTYELGKTKYVFSNEGKTLEMTYIDWVGSEQTNTYHYSKQESNSQARYGGYLIQLDNKDNDISCSTVANVAVSLSIMEYLAHLKRETADTFTGTIKGMTFSIRDKDSSGLDSDILHSITFDSSGKTATIKQTVYDGEETSQSVSAEDGSSSTEGRVNSQTVNLDTNKSPWELTYNGKTYFASYSDPGPSFIYRVRNKTYVEAGKTKDTGYSYTFSPDGKTCTYKNPHAGLFETGEAIYTYYDAEKRDDSGISAAYNGPFQIGSFGTVWGFKLTASDTTLAGSSAAMADANSILGVSGTFTSKPALLDRTQ